MSYAMLALAALAIAAILPRLVKFSLKDGSFELRAVGEKLDRNNRRLVEIDRTARRTAKRAAISLQKIRDATEDDARSRGGLVVDGLPQAEFRHLVPPRRVEKLRLGDSVNEEDPQKGRFGGQAANAGRELQASVSPGRDDGEWFAVRLRVVASDPGHPLSGAVTFFLHDTFEPDWITVPVRGGEAKLSISAYGAFTVGALCDDGATALELDLAELADAPETFRSR